MSKAFKRIMLIILIVACLYNIVTKIIKRYSMKEELVTSATYMEEQNNK